MPFPLTFSSHTHLTADTSQQRKSHRSLGPGASMSRGGVGFLSPPHLLLPHTHLDHLQVLCSSRHSCLYFPNGPPSVCQSLLPALQASCISESPQSTSLTTCFSKNLLLETFSVLAALKRFSFLHCHSA